MLVDVLRRRQMDTNARRRIIDLDQDKSFVILNKLAPPATWDGPVFAGQLIQLHEGTEIPAVTQSLEEDTEEFVLQNLAVGERTRILKGALYFAVVGNHVGIIEGHQVRGRTLERYLTRLFDQAGELDPGDVISLNAEFFTDEGKRLDESTEVTVAARPNTGGDEPGGDRGLVGRDAGQAHGGGATVYEVLELLGWDEDAINSLRSEVPREGKVEGLFKVTIREKRKRRPITRATINHALRNIDPADLSLRGNGSEKNGIVRLSVVRPVESEKSLLDPASAMEQIVNALRDWAAAGKIDCRFE